MPASPSAIDALFNAPGLGWDAVYTAENGRPVGVRVFRRQPEGALDLGDDRLAATVAVFDVRISEVAAPRAGDRLDLGGETFVVHGRPRRDDGRLIWTLQVRPG
jgi:hypothetical protein